MGKHSARDGQGGREDRSRGAAGAFRGPLPPPPPTGNGRRRRGYDPFTDTGGFATVRPQDLDGPPPAHPEHREHAAWGAAGDWAEPGRGHGGTRELAPDPMESWAEDWAPMGAPAGPRPPAGSGAPRHTQTAPRPVPRPRQDFVAAFDAPPAPAPPRGPDTGTAPAPEAEPDGSGGGKGRTLSGIAAAAVVTVLAVVATGQVTGGDKKHTGPTDKSTATRSSDAGASRSKLRDAPQSAAPTAPATKAAAPTYDQLMAKIYPLDPDLRLSGAFTTMPGHQRAPGHGTVKRFRVDVEKGLPLDAALFTETVFKTLNDSRSWGHGGAMTFERVSTGPADIVITLASPGTTDKWCAKSGLDTSVEHVSCDAASTPRTMINAYRWAQGAATYGPGRIHLYRQMLINHEVGHRLGHGHVGCPAQGAQAPVMMQQTKFLSVDGGPACRPNPWPFP